MKKNCVESETRPTNGSSNRYRMAAMEASPVRFRRGWNQSDTV